LPNVHQNKPMRGNLPVGTVEGMPRRFEANSIMPNSWLNVWGVCVRVRVPGVQHRNVAASSGNRRRRVTLNAQRRQRQQRTSVCATTPPELVHAQRRPHATPIRARVAGCKGTSSLSNVANNEQTRAPARQTKEEC
jgi:hypothetical protein